jgi:hypothetical protein
MNAEPGTIIHVGVAISLALMVGAAARGKPAVVSADGSLLFRYNVMFRGLAFFFMFALPLALSVLIFFVPVKKEDLWAIIGMFAMIAVIGLPLWREATRFALIVTPDGLDCRSPWLSNKFIAWVDVEAISFSSINQWFIINARDGRTFRIHLFMSGVPYFLSLCEMNLHTSVLARAKVGYFQVGRPFPGP